MPRILGVEIAADDSVFTHDWTINPEDETSVLTCKTCEAVLYSPTKEFLWFYQASSSIPTDPVSCDENIMRQALE